jgi:hypothetical protein
VFGRLTQVKAQLVHRFETCERFRHFIPSFFFVFSTNDGQTPGAVIVCCYTERARVLRCVWSLLLCVATRRQSKANFRWTAAAACFFREERPLHPPVHQKPENTKKRKKNAFIARLSKISTIDTHRGFKMSTSCTLRTRKFMSNRLLKRRQFVSVRVA